MRKGMFSYQKEKDYYSKAWPKKAISYKHLDPYLRCWLDPEEVFSNKRVLDIGAGECTYTRLIADRYEPETIVACELFQERMVPVARANENHKLYFISGNSFQFPFKKNSFDVIFGSFILHQLPGLDSIVSEIKRVLRKRGVYVGIEPNPFNPFILYRFYLKTHSPNQYLLSPRHLRIFSNEEFEVEIRFFYAKQPKIRSRFINICMGVIAMRNT
jgi:ubiquinone/menaquinone biosynthesis C-methylase UbiE